MATLSLVQRRSLTAELADAAPPVLDELSRSLGTPITVRRETPRSWHFVIPEQLPAPGEPLPEPANDRERLDNAILELFIEDRAFADQAVRQPAVLGAALFGRLPDDFFFHVGPEDRVEIHREAPNELAIVIPLAARKFRIDDEHELSDEMLDLVAGGGRYPCNTDDSRFKADNAARPADGGGNG